MIEDFRDATPVEFFAFYQLGEFIIGDVRTAIELMMKQGHDGEFFAELAFDLGLSDLDEGDKFGKAVLETGLKRLPSKKESIWLAVRYYLMKIKQTPKNAVMLIGKVINLQFSFREIELFDRPDCDAHFAEMQKKYPSYARRKFVAQGWGIEKLYEIYYDSDDWFYYKSTRLSYDAWLENQKKIQISNLIVETERVVKSFYSRNSKLPSSLKGVIDLI